MNDINSQMNPNELMSLAPPSIKPSGVASAANTAAAVDPTATATASSFADVTINHRDSLNGAWILDKNRGDWSMRGYLETLNVPELAIQANEKGDNELDTIHIIEFSTSQEAEEETEHKVEIIKRSRVNNDLIVGLILGKENIEHLKPDDRPKIQLATTEDLIGKTHLQIVSSLLTVNGMAHVTDIKNIIQEEQIKGKTTVMIQKLTITNPETKKTHTTTRYFNPHKSSSPSSETATTTATTK